MTSLLEETKLHTYIEGRRDGRKWLTVLSVGASVEMLVLAK